MSERGQIRTLDGKIGGTPGPATSTPLEIDLSDYEQRNCRYLTVQHLGTAAGKLLVMLDEQPGVTIDLNKSFSIRLSSLRRLRIAATSGTVEWEGVLTVAR